MVIEDGKIYELPTPMGVLTVVSDLKAVFPIRVYGPDGMQLDPSIVAKMTCCRKHCLSPGLMAWDLGRLVSR